MFELSRQFLVPLTMASVLFASVVFVKHGHAQVSASVAPAAAVGGAGQKTSGLVLEPRFGLQSLVFALEGTNLSSVVGGFMIGGKHDRIIWGLGFDYSRMAIDVEGNGSDDFYYGYYGEDRNMDSSLISLMVVPGIRVAVLRSNDQKAELTAQGDVGFGTSFQGGDETFGDDVFLTGSDPDIFNFKYSVGPGLRYWAHPQFALGMVALLQGNVMREKSSSNKLVLHSMSVATALQLTGVF